MTAPLSPYFAWAFLAMAIAWAGSATAADVLDHWRDKRRKKTKGDR